VIKLAEYPLSYQILNSLEGEFFENSDHGYRHSLDLIKTAEMMILKHHFDVDYEVLLTVIYLHDLFADTGIKHGFLAVEFFDKNFADMFTTIQVSKIREAILYHDDKTIESQEKRKKQAVESQLLYDLDNIDAFGIKGVYRYIKVYQSRGIEIESVARLVEINSESRFKTLCFESSKEWCREEFLYIHRFFQKACEHGSVEENILKHIYKRADIPIENLCKSYYDIPNFSQYTQEENLKIVKFFDTLYQIYK